MDTGKRIHRIAARIDENASEEDKKVFAVLIASTNVGASVKRIAKVLKMPRGPIYIWSRNLRKSKIWVKGKVDAKGWSGKDGGVEFILSVLVAQGLMVRTNKNS